MEAQHPGEEPQVRNVPSAPHMPQDRLNNHNFPALCTALAAAALLLAACKSTKSDAGSPQPGNGQVVLDGAGQPQPYDPKIWDKGPPDPLGAYLAELDKSMRAWTNLTLTAQTRNDRTKASMLQQDLIRRVDARKLELVDALETGPPRNRAIAAGALGFSSTHDIQGPLIVALTDKDESVVQNACLSLALQQEVNTPLAPLLEVMQGNLNGLARANAAYAIRTILEAGAPSNEDVVKASRRGLLDIEPFVQAQSTLILALAEDGESVPDLGEMLGGESPLVIGAAIQSLLALGRGDPKLLGPTARALVGGLTTAPVDMRPAVLRALGLLSGHSYGTDTKAWNEWAQRLP